MRTVLITRQLTVLTAAGALAMLGLAGSASASVGGSRPGNGPSGAHRGVHGPAVLTHRFARPRLPAGERYACGTPTRPGQMTCMSIIRTGTGTPLATPAATAATNGSYGPSDLRKAYKLVNASRFRGRGRLVAIVDAFNDPHAAGDLARYRAHYHLPPCGTASGCLTIVNEHGRKRPLPRANANWAVEESLDLDMVSAICPKCHILLVEAKNNSPVNLGIAENTAARRAKYVSNSWSGFEFLGQDYFDHYFNHPGVAIDFASGDFGYGASYPADLQYVTSIGGTTLRHARNRRGWSESVWGVRSNGYGTGSGCSTLAAKASWQRADARQPDGCLNRTQNDAAAVANPATGVVAYDSYKRRHIRIELGGTSVATPIITGIYALAGKPTAHTYPAEYPYLHGSHLFDVTSGVNGRCEAFRKYLCHGVRGFDGPTGRGTPHGTGAFTDHGRRRVTVVDPGTVDVAATTSVSLKITGLDTRKVSSLTYTANGLPAGLHIAPIAHSASARITGTLSVGASGNHFVTVRAKDGTVTGTTHFNIAVVPSLTEPAAAPGEVALREDSLNLCLDDSGGTSGALVKVTTCASSASQLWRYTADGGPDSTGSFGINGLCLDVNSSNQATLATCDPTRHRQDWEYLGFGGLGNLGTGKCLAAGSTASGALARVAGCRFLGPQQTWWLPAGPVMTGVGSGLCLDNTSGTSVDVATCTTSVSQQWDLNGDGTISSNSGLCLSGNGSLNSGTAITASICDPNDFSQFWIPGPGGQLINYWSGRCLADPGNGASGTIVKQEDCYGQVGEVWGLN